MHNLPIVFADLADLIKLAFVVLFFLGPAIGKLLQQPKQQQRPRRPPRPDDDPPVGGGLAGPQPAKPAQAGRDALEAEIEEFLKRAGGKGAAPRRPQQRPQPAPPSPRPTSPLPPREPTPQVARRPVREGGSPVSAHVREHITSDPVSEHSKQLGREVGGRDEKLEDHLHDVFDHDLGQLKKRATSRATDDVIREGTDDDAWETTSQRREREAEQAQERAARVAQMLRDPSNVREAIILSEILKPPMGAS